MKRSIMISFVRTFVDSGSSNAGDVWASQAEVRARHRKELTLAARVAGVRPARRLELCKHREANQEQDCRASHDIKGGTGRKQTTPIIQ